MGTQLTCAGGWCGRTDSEDASFIGGSGHHPPIPSAADNHRFASQRRVLAYLHRHIKRIHVDVEDGGHNRSIWRSLPRVPVIR